VEDFSPAAKAGACLGMRVMRVGTIAVSTAEEFASAIFYYKQQKHAAVNVW